MKFVKLLASAYVNGVIRHPHEGVLHLEDDEADRLVKGGLGSDVSDDFTAKQDDAAGVDSVSAPGSGVETSEPVNPHQAEVAPQGEDTAPAPATHTRRKAASSKE